MNEPQLTSTMSNTTTASSDGTQGAQASSLNATVALNEVSGNAQATIASSTTTAGNGVSVTAQDNAGISATVTLGSSLTTSGSSTGVGAAVAMNDVQGGATALVSSTTADCQRRQRPGAGQRDGHDHREHDQRADVGAADLDSNGTSSSNNTGGGTTSSPLAVGGLIGSNVVQSAATATLSNSQRDDHGRGRRRRHRRCREHRQA